MDRKILHVDMNAFYASVECFHRPEIRDKAVAVGGESSDRHGIILAKNEKAKKYGVKTGEALWKAREKCPGLIVVRPNYPLYIRYSKMARKIYYQYSNLVEPFGLDEAWIDVSGADAPSIAEEIRERIKNELGVTVSIGISWCKIFAKFGSDYKKPDACTFINRENYKKIVWPSPVGSLLYVGPGTAAKLNELGIKSIGELAVTDPSFLEKRFGIRGGMLHAFANGNENSRVSDMKSENNVKSVGNSITTPTDIKNERYLKVVLCTMCESVAARLREGGLAAGALETSLRFSDLSRVSFQKKLSEPTMLSSELILASERLIHEKAVYPLPPIRSVGVRAMSLSDSSAVARGILPYEKNREKLMRLEESIDSIRGVYGYSSVRRGLLIKHPIGGTDAKSQHIIHPLSYFKNGEKFEEAIC